MTAVVSLALAAPPASDDDSSISLMSVAGTYYAAGPDGGICRLDLRAAGRYSEVCNHGYTMLLHHGRIQLGRTKLALWSDDRRGRFSSLADLEMFGAAEPGVDGDFLPPIWRPVTWGERRYLLSRTQLLHFCIAVADGSEPRSQRVGRFYLRENDEMKPAPTPAPLPECNGSVPPGRW